MAKNEIFRVAELLNSPKRCPQCSRMHVTEDTFCEHCLCNLLNYSQLIGSFFKQ